MSIKPVNSQPFIPARAAELALAETPVIATHAHPRVAVGDAMHLLSMNDDLSALIAAFSRRRKSDESKPATELPAWAGQLLEDEAHERFIQLRQAAPGLASADQLKDLLHKLFPDPSDAVLALRILGEDETIDEVTRRRLHDLEQLLLASDGKAIRAGINVAQKARLFSSERKISAKALRQTYRNFLESEEPAADQYGLWIEEYGFLQRGQVVTFLERAIGADMMAANPSCTDTEFGNPLRSIRELCTVRSADSIFLRDAWCQGTMKKIGMTEEGLVRSLLALTRGVNALNDLFEGAFARSPLALDTREKVVLIQRVRRALHAVPYELWHAEEHHRECIERLDILADRLHAKEASLVAPHGFLAS